MDVVFGTSGKPEQKPGKLQAAVEAGAAMAAKGVEVARAVSDSPGAAPLWAGWRQGADEIAQALVAFPAQSIQPVGEPGQLFEPTPQMVTEQITGRMSLSDIMAAGREVEVAREQKREQQKGLER